MDEKYINLLLDKCTTMNQNKILFIHYSKEIKPFIEKLIKIAKIKGVEEIYQDEFDIEEIHTFLKNHTKEEIKESDFFNESIWDTYATKKASFLIFETEYPGVMDDIEEEKIALSSKIKRESRPLYRKMVEKCEISWCIAAYPGERWAKKIYKEENAYEKLKDAIYRMCMINEENPNKSWEEHLNKLEKIEEYLNQLNLEKLIYHNHLGTNLEVILPENYRFATAKDNDIIVNMPSYEVFTSPHYQKVNGKAYASKPLIYNGALIKDFWIELKNGKVINYDAKIGKEVLKGIIESDNNSCYLGECALVEKDSPIARENTIFETTLLDENASCHLALGAGFAECIENGLALTDEELLEKGINVSKNHVDFMIGTNDLSIKGITKDGKEIIIMEEGNFSKNIKKEVIC